MIGGMIAVVILALLMVPVFFVQRVLEGDREKVVEQGVEAHGPPASQHPSLSRRNGERLQH